MNYHTFPILTPSGDRRIVAHEAEWAAVEKLPAGTVVDVRGDVFEDGCGPIHDSGGKIIHDADGWYFLLEPNTKLDVSGVRARLFKLIDSRKDVTFIVTTRHAGNVAEMMPVLLGLKCPDCGWESSRPDLESLVQGDRCPIDDGCDNPLKDTPLIRPNLWPSVVVRTQAEADAMIPDLLKLPAAKRVVDVVPAEAIVLNQELLGETRYEHCSGCERVSEEEADCPGHEVPGGIDLVRIYGESDPIHPEWVRSLIQQCESAGAAVQFLGWGDWAGFPKNSNVWRVGGINTFSHMVRVGRESSGNLIDGREVMQWPK